MQHLLASVLTNLQDILQGGGYWIIAFIAIAESLPLFGTIVPGHTVIILAGVFAKLGYLNLYTVLLLTVIGAIIGDIIGYTIGRKYGFPILIKWGKYFLIKQEHLDKAKTMLNRHTGKALIVGRFSPITRALMPFLAGASDVPKGKFWFFTIIGGIVWSTSSVMIGYIFGASYHIAAQYIGRYTTVGIAIIVLIVIAYHFINTRRHIFAKYDLHLLLICLPALYVFFSSVEDVMSYRPFMALLDVRIFQIVGIHQIEWVRMLMQGVSHVFSPATLSLVVLGALGWWVWKKHWHNIAITIAAYPTGLVFAYLLKEVVGRIRPPNLLEASGYSFPSGHAVAATLFFSLVIYFFTRYIRNHYYRELFIAANVVAIILVCASRVYLSVHWMSDVVGGAAFGVFWVSFMILTVRYVEGLTTGRYAKKLHE